MINPNPQAERPDLVVGGPEDIGMPAANGAKHKRLVIGRCVIYRQILLLMVSSTQQAISLPNTSDIGNQVSPVFQIKVPQSARAQFPSDRSGLSESLRRLYKPGRFEMGQLLSREVSILASFDYVSFDDVHGTNLNTPRFWEGDPNESTLPTPKYVRSPNVTVRDIRGQETSRNITKDGFQLLDFPSAYNPHPDRQEEVRAYLQETAGQVRKLLNASQAFVFDYRVCIVPSTYACFQ